jgi:hypothetical protein
MGNTTPKPKSNMEPYYQTITNKLQYVINCSKNKKIISITPIYKEQIPQSQEFSHKGIKIKYDDNQVYDLSCDSVEIGAIMWYYNIDNKKYTNCIDDEFQSYIKKHISKK